jgi:hypothetical protein
LSDKEENNWSVRKEVSWGQIITILMVAAGAMLFTVRLESKIEINAENIEHNRTDMIDHKAENNSQYAEIIRRLERISDQINAKADKP